MKFRWFASQPTSCVPVVALAFVAAAAFPRPTVEQRKPLTSDIARVLSREGTWTLSLVKSHYDPGPPPKSGTRTIEPLANGTRQRTEGVDAAGNRVAYEYTANYDGRDYPIVGSGIPNEAETISLKRVDNATVEATLKKEGKVVLTARSVLSTDGRVLTYTVQGTDVTGRPINNVIIWERR